MDVFMNLFENTIVFMAMISLSVIWTTNLRRSRSYFKYVMGVVLSLMSVFIMINSVHVGNGLYIDARYAIPIVAIIFFGLIPGTMVSITIIIARIFLLGGAGIPVGVTFTIIQFIAVYIYKIKYYDKHKEDSILRASIKLAGLSFVLQVVLLTLPLAFMSFDVAIDAIKSNFTYLLTIYPIIVYLFSFVVEYRNDYLNRIEDGLMRDKFFETVLKRSLNPIAIVEEAGRILHLNDAWTNQTGFDCTQYENLIQWFEDTKGPSKTTVDEIRLQLNEQSKIIYDVYTENQAKKVWSIEQKEAGILTNGNPFYVLIGKDITKDMELQEKLMDMSYTDFLTGLYNRRYFYEVFEEKFKKHSGAFVLYGDMNDLKSVNDYYGHFKGDEAIVVCTNVLQKFFQDDSTLFRFGGDEFLIVSQTIDKDTCIERINNINMELEKYSFGNISIGISIGLHQLLPNQTLDEAVMKAESRMYEYKIFESSSARSGAIDIILAMLFEKDKETERHSKRVQKISNVFGEHLDLRTSQSSLLSRAALMHDIGKILIPTNIILSVNKLSDEEFEIIKNHSFLGYRILSRKPQFKDVSEIILSHHERIDGLGYPNHLKGEDIPFTARILHIVDAFEAMTSDRPYAVKKSYDEAKQELLRCSGTQFDTELVLKFVEIIDQLPES
jgi:diguanylate cyclase (GGDEF)-like protein/PAS domain S-box-containing protein